MYFHLKCRKMIMHMNTGWKIQTWLLPLSSNKHKLMVWPSPKPTLTSAEKHSWITMQGRQHNKISAQAFGLIVRSLITDGQWNGAAVEEKGKCFLHAVQRFTNSPWLPRRGYVTRTCEGKKGQRKWVDRRERQREEGGNRWCHTLHSTKRGSNQQGKHTLLFPVALIQNEMPKRWIQTSDFSRCGKPALFGISGKKKEGRRRPKFHIRFLSNGEWCGVSRSSL